MLSRSFQSKLTHFKSIKTFTPIRFYSITDSPGYKANKRCTVQKDFRRLSAWNKTLENHVEKTRMRGDRTKRFLSQIINSAKNDFDNRPNYDSFHTADSFFYRRNLSYNSKEDK